MQNYIKGAALSLVVSVATKALYRAAIVYSKKKSLRGSRRIVGSPRAFVKNYLRLFFRIAF